MPAMAPLLTLALLAVAARSGAEPTRAMEADAGPHRITIGRCAAPPL